MRSPKCPNCHSNDTVFEDIQVGTPITCVCNECNSRFELQAYMLDDTTENTTESENDPVNAPSHYIGKIECIDYLRDKLTKEEFTGFCMGNVLKYSSRWRKKDGLQDLKKAKVYLEWAIDNEEKSNE